MENRKNFKSLSDFNGKKICITGKVEDYKGNPQIVIVKPEEMVFQ